VSTPARMGTVIGAQPWFAKGTLEQRQCLRDVVTAAARQCRERRERIKAHPDLADRLCRSLGLSRLDQWSGYIPAARDSDGVPNRSPIRAELIAILREVVNRETAAGESAGEGAAEWE